MSNDTSQAHLDDELDRLHTVLTAFDEYDPESGDSDSESTPSGEYAHGDAFAERHSLEELSKYGVTRSRAPRR